MLAARVEEVADRSELGVVERPAEDRVERFGEGPLQLAVEDGVLPTAPQVVQV